ncbi:unnamed protein product, partial [Candidula unifasciata]
FVLLSLTFYPWFICRVLIDIHWESQIKDTACAQLHRVLLVKADFSDTENCDVEEGRYPAAKYPPRRISYDVTRPYREQAPPYRRSHSLAELQAEREREKLAAQQEGPGRPPVGSRATERRSTLSSLVFSSLAALDQTGNAVIPPYVKKKHKRQVIGLPDTPVALTELNLEELIPRYAPPIKPTGKLKLQLLWSTDKTSLTVIIIE